MKKKVFSAAIEYLHEMLDFIKEYCVKEGFDSSAVNKIVLAAEEAIVNVIYHGYKNESKKFESEIIEILCEETSQKPGIKIVIKDYGIPFNPMDKGDKIKKMHKTPVEDRSIGGYGIFLYVEIMDQVEYQREGGGNFLCLIKYL